MRNKIIQTIQLFKIKDTRAIEEKYLCGDCYVFAEALSKKFNGEIYYLPIDNHFITKISGDFYDIRGLVPDEELYECYEWETYKILEPLDADRVEYYCITGKEKISI